MCRGSMRCAAVLLCAAALCVAAAGARTAAAAAAAAEPAGTGDLGDTMRLLAQRRHGTAGFVEQQFLAMLKKPVESRGELIYDAPDRLEKRTIEPHPESLLLEGDVLTVQRGRRRHVLDLRSYPQILPFVESIRATLAGDLPALSRVFNVEFTGSLERWSLRLVPLDSALAKTVARIRIEGARDSLLSVEIRQPDGDRSLMTVRPHDPP